MLTHERKVEMVTELSSSFKRSRAAFLVDFKGLSVEQVTTLRKQLTQVGAEFKVVRNTLAIRALADHEAESGVLASKLVGTNAFVFAYEEVSTPAKTLTKFAKDMENLKVKSGVMGGEELDDNKIKFLSTLPGKDELRVMLLGTLQASANQFVRILNAVPQGVVTVLKAYTEKKIDK